MRWYARLRGPEGVAQKGEGGYCARPAACKRAKQYQQFANKLLLLRLLLLMLLPQLLLVARGGLAAEDGFEGSVSIGGLLELELKRV